MPGLRFRKLDLPPHTPDSEHYSCPEHAPALIVQSALARNLVAIAITDPLPQQMKQGSASWTQFLWVACWIH